MSIVKIPEDCFHDIMRHLCPNLRDLLALATTCNTLSDMLNDSNCVGILLEELDPECKDYSTVQAVRRFKKSMITIDWLGKISWHHQLSLLQIENEDEEVRTLLADKLLKSVPEQTVPDSIHILSELHRHGILPDIWPSNIYESRQAQIELIRFIFMHPFRALRLLKTLGFELFLYLVHPWIITAVLIYSLFRDMWPTNDYPPLGILSMFCASVFQYLKNKL